jgi:hypothetical protein
LQVKRQRKIGVKAGIARSDSQGHFIIISGQVKSPHAIVACRDTVHGVHVGCFLSKSFPEAFQGQCHVAECEVSTSFSHPKIRRLLARRKPVRFCADREFAGLRASGKAYG